MFIHTTLIPIMGSVGEEKTKPTQHSVKELMSIGVRPDIIVGRCSEPISDAARAKIAMFCDVPEEAVISTPDARSIYEVPLNLERQGVADYIIEKMKLGPMTSPRDMRDWEDLVDRIVNPEKEVRIALVGKYTSLADSYLSHLEAFTHAGAASRCRVRVKFIDSDDLTSGDPDALLGDVHGILVPGGFGIRGVEGKIVAARYARENVPRGLPRIPDSHNRVLQGCARIGQGQQHGVRPTDTRSGHLHHERAEGGRRHGCHDASRSPGGPCRGRFEGPYTVWKDRDLREAPSQVRGQPRLHRNDGGQGLEVHRTFRMRDQDGDRGARWPPVLRGIAVPP